MGKSYPHVIHIVTNKIIERMFVILLKSTQYDDNMFSRGGKQMFASGGRTYE